MGNKTVVPDAWDDDWESQADKEEGGVGLALPLPLQQQEVKLTKAERLAQHAETNKKIWQSAEEPETFHFLAARDAVPLKTEFKPALKVLSRKPTPKQVRTIDPVTGLATMTLEDPDDTPVQTHVPSSEELRLKAQREREEKQKRYDEVRARIMGTPSGGNSPGTATPLSDGSKSNRGKGRGKNSVYQENSRPPSQSSNKELYDPDYTAKPGISIHKRHGEGSRSGRSTPRDEENIIRGPRGPDGSGRGGFGFANRGGKTS